MIWQKLLWNKILKTKPPIINRQACFNNKINRYNNKKECRKCADNCPHNAIKLSHRGIYLNAEECTGCGNCISICPTNAITTSDINYNKKFRELCALTNPVLGCYWVNSEVDFSFPCLYSIGQDFWQAYFIEQVKRNGEINLYLGRCHFCDNFKNYPFFIRFIKNARLLVEDMGFEENLSINGLFSEPQLKEKRTENKQEENLGNVSRRELFSSIRRETTETFRELTSEILTDKHKYFKGSATFNQERAVFLNSLRSVANFSVRAKTGLKIAWLNIDTDCNGCGICVKNCDNKALVKEQGHNGYENLIFIKQRPWLCIDCGTCRYTCPHNAIVKSSFQNFIINLFNERTLANLVVKGCIHCGNDRVFHSYLQDKTVTDKCSSCRKKERIEF